MKASFLNLFMKKFTRERLSHQVKHWNATCPALLIEEVERLPNLGAMV